MWDQENSSSFLELLHAGKVQGETKRHRWYEKSAQVQVNKNAMKPNKKRESRDVTNENKKNNGWVRLFSRRSSSALIRRSVLRSWEERAVDVDNVLLLMMMMILMLVSLSRVQFSTPDLNAYFPITAAAVLPDNF